ncbi:MAG: hypothetical protein ACYS5W_10725 [Planctomycetota bacterium]|jgi:hypothetical protein
MQYRFAAGVLGVVVTLCTLALVPTLAPPVPPDPDPAPAIPTGPTGHLVLLIEGDARGLAVTHITTKPDAYNPVHDVKTPYELVVYDSNDNALGRYPLDLSKFDLDPKNVGKPLEVKGCEVIDRKVAMLTNIPWFPNASFLDIQRSGMSVGELLREDYARLLAEDKQAQGRQR